MLIFMFSKLNCGKTNSKQMYEFYMCSYNLVAQIKLCFLKILSSVI